MLQLRLWVGNQYGNKGFEGRRNGRDKAQPTKQDRPPNLVGPANSFNRQFSCWLGVYKNRTVWFSVGVKTESRGLVFTPTIYSLFRWDLVAFFKGKHPCENYYIYLIIIVCGYQSWDYIVSQDIHYLFCCLKIFKEMYYIVLILYNRVVI